MVALNHIIIDQEFESLCPQLAEEEQQQLQANIEQDGFRDGVVVWKEERILLDGHHRMQIYQELYKDTKKKPTPIEKSFKTRDEAKEWIILNQFGRRNLTPFQRAELALHLEPILKVKEKAKNNQKRGGNSGSVGRQKSGKRITTDRELAKTAGVSHDTIHKAKVISATASEKTKKELRNGSKSINQAYGEVMGRPPKSAKSDEFGLSAHEAAKRDPGVRWEKAFHDLYKYMNSIRDFGGIATTASEWSQKYRDQSVEEIENIIGVLKGWIKDLESIK